MVTFSGAPLVLPVAPGDWSEPRLACQGASMVEDGNERVGLRYNSAMFFGEGLVNG